MINDRVHRLFREKSVEDISSPDELNDFICAVKPGNGFLVGAIIMMIAGLAFWFRFGL